MPDSYVLKSLTKIYGGKNWVLRQDLNAGPGPGNLTRVAGNRRPMRTRTRLGGAQSVCGARRTTPRRCKFFVFDLSGPRSGKSGLLEATFKGELERSP